MSLYFLFFRGTFYTIILVTVIFDLEDTNFCTIENNCKDLNLNFTGALLKLTNAIWQGAKTPVILTCNGG